MELKHTPSGGSTINLNKQSSDWFPGLNALRFFAASLVAIMHIHSNQDTAKLPVLPDWQILFKGLYAVSFFFVLSGFLITYLLLRERQNTHTISIRAFYLRRVFRIWPLYFIVVIIGMFFYWKLVPALHLNFESNYPHGLAIFLYSIFLSNLIGSLYHVGGILHVTWSIGVEEQFYLFWAPLVKRFKNNLLQIIIAITAFSLLLNNLNTLHLIPVTNEWQVFINTLQFHYMGIGAAFAWMLFNKREQLLSQKVFTNKWLQALLTAAIVSFLLFYQKTTIGEVITPIPVGLLFGWLIINVSSNPYKIFTLETRLLNYCGKISYGIYMYHMPMVYLVTFLFSRFKLVNGIPFLSILLCYGLIFILTVGLASLSFYFIEKPILSKGKAFKPKVALSN